MSDTTGADSAGGKRTEQIYVLYASQTGNSEQAAIELCDDLHRECTTKHIQTAGGTTDEITVRATHMQMDDFLEVKQCKWTSLVLLFCSSYGVGQAPLGGYRFRDLCEEWLQSDNDTHDAKLLSGISFGLCGLGDSSYDTFFENPTRIHDGLERAGAARIGPLGKVDYADEDADPQDTIKQWKQEMIKEHIPKLLASSSQSSQQTSRLEQAQHDCVKICRKINPEFPVVDYTKTKSNDDDDDTPSKGASYYVMPLFFLLVAVVLGAMIKEIVVP